MDNISYCIWFSQSLSVELLCVCVCECIRHLKSLNFWMNFWALGMYRPLMRRYTKSWYSYNFYCFVYLFRDLFSGRLFRIIIYKALYIHACMQVNIIVCCSPGEFDWIAFYLNHILSSSMLFTMCKNPINYLFTFACTNGLTILPQTTQFTSSIEWKRSGRGRDWARVNRKYSLPSYRFQCIQSPWSNPIEFAVMVESNDVHPVVKWTRWVFSWVELMAFASTTNVPVREKKHQPINCWQVLFILRVLHSIYHLRSDCWANSLYIGWFLCVLCMWMCANASIYTVGRVFVCEKRNEEKNHWAGKCDDGSQKKKHNLKLPSNEMNTAN